MPVSCHYSPLDLFNKLYMLVSMQIILLIVVTSNKYSCIKKKFPKRLYCIETFSIYRKLRKEYNLPYILHSVFSITTI